MCCFSARGIKNKIFKFKNEGGLKKLTKDLVHNLILQ